MELRENPAHVEPLPICIIKETYNGNSDQDFVKLKLHGYPTSSMSDLYEFNMSLFGHKDTEEFLSFMHNFNIILAATGTLEMDAKIQYISMLFRAEVLRQF